MVPAFLYSLNLILCKTDFSLGRSVVPVPNVSDLERELTVFLKYRFVFVSGDAGGQLGLVLGASVVTILEFVDLLIFLAINWFRSKP